MIGRSLSLAAVRACAAASRGGAVSSHWARRADSVSRDESGHAAFELVIVNLRRRRSGDVAAPARHPPQASGLPQAEALPMAGIVEGDWVELTYRGEPATSRVLRTVY